MSAYPEHQKLKAISDKSQCVADFWDYMEQQGIVFAERGENSQFLYHTMKNKRDFIAEFFDIDMNKIEAEKRAMIEDLQKINR